MFFDMSLNLLNTIMHNVYSLISFLIIDYHLLRRKTGWLKIEDRKMDEDESAVELRRSCEEWVLSCDEHGC